jgi:hypothetical protein
MLTKQRNRGLISVVNQPSQDAARRLRKRRSGDRATLGVSEPEAQRDPAAPMVISPNSRQSRGRKQAVKAAPQAASSYSQGRDQTMTDSHVSPSRTTEKVPEKQAELDMLVTRRRQLLQLQTIHRYKLKLMQRGKAFKVAMTACMRKLLTLLNTLAQTGNRLGRSAIGPGEQRMKRQTLWIAESPQRQRWH